jgi:hypothetical protein
MKTYKVAVEWTMTKTLMIAADDLDEAMELAQDKDLPDDGEYLDESFTVNTELSEEINSQDDDGNKDEDEED